MIEPRGRGVDPASLALPLLVGARTPVDRAARPLAVALETLNVHLVSGERLSPVEVRQLVGLVRTALDVFATPSAREAPAHGGNVLHEALDLVRTMHVDLVQVLRQHQQLTATLAPILRELLVALGSTPVSEPAQAVAAPVVDADALPTPSSPTAAPAPPASTLSAIVAGLAEAVEALIEALPQEVLAAADEILAAEEPAARRPGPPPNKLVHALILVVRQLQVLLPSGATMPAPLARALAEAVALVGELVAPTGQPAPVAEGGASTPATPAPAARTPSLPPPPEAIARLATSASRILGQLEQLSPTPSAPPPAARLAVQPAPVSDARVPLPLSAAEAPAPPPASTQPGAVPTPRTIAPQATPVVVPAPVTVPVPVPGAPPPLAIALAEVKAQLQGILSVAVFEAAALPTAAALESRAVLAALTLAAAAPLPPAPSGTPLGTPMLYAFDPYRWGLLASLHYRDIAQRPRDRQRCFICLRLMIRSLSGELQCPRCY